MRRVRPLHPQGLVLTTRTERSVLALASCGSSRAGNDETDRIAAVPAGSDERLKRALYMLAPSPPSASSIEGTVRAALPEPGVDPSTSAKDHAPTVTARTNGKDIGVAVWAAPTRTCLLGARLGDVVEVWRPSAVQLMPGELTCDPGTALGRGGITPPH